MIRAINQVGAKNITAVSNDAGVRDAGIGILIENNQISKLYASYVGEHKSFMQLYGTGKLEVVFTPQVNNDRLRGMESICNLFQLKLYPAGHTGREAAMWRCWCPRVLHTRRSGHSGGVRRFPNQGDACGSFVGLSSILQWCFLHQYHADHSVAAVSSRKESRSFNGRKYILEEA